ncbi:MAG TPA: hypothetical protein DEF42_10270 [Desulfosporosinus sp.]|nr:hypothetical protein [Desulfosporosinus sp.]
MNGYDSNLARKKQAEYCRVNKVPHFAPESGRCWRCHRNIYDPWTRMNPGYIKTDTGYVYGDVEVTTGITVDKAEKELVTGCPHCNRSYCD